MHSKKECGILVLISGDGSNLQKLIDAQKISKLSGKIKCVISSKKDAHGLVRAQKSNIYTRVHSLKDYFQGTSKGDVFKRQELRQKFNIDLANLIIHDSYDKKCSHENYEAPELVVCAGWMIILSPEFLKIMKEHNIQVINLHPALPNTFNGTHAIERAWKSYQNGEIKKTGVMVHYVIQEVDMGDPIIVKDVLFIKNETLDSFKTRVHSVEHIAIVEATNIVLNGIYHKHLTEEL